MIYFRRFIQCISTIFPFSFSFFINISVIVAIPLYLLLVLAESFDTPGEIYVLGLNPDEINFVFHPPGINEISTD